MYNQKTNFNIVIPNTGKSIEETIREQLATKAPLEMVAEKIYTERKDGVQPQYDIRTDRFDIAVEAHDARARASIARRQQEDAPKEIKNNEPIETI